MVVLLLSLVNGAITATPTIRELVAQQIEQSAKKCDLIRQEQIDRAACKDQTLPIQSNKLLQAHIEHEALSNIEKCMKWKSKYNGKNLANCRNNIINELEQKYLSEPNNYPLLQKKQFKNTVNAALDNTTKITNEIITQDQQFAQR